MLNGGSFVVSLAWTYPYFLFCIRADVKAMWEEGVAESSGGGILCIGLGVEMG